MRLSDRLRPHVEAAQWVIDEVRKQDAEIERLRAEIVEWDRVCKQHVKQCQKLSKKLRNARKQERERCAKVCEENEPVFEGYGHCCAADIRALEDE